VRLSRPRRRRCRHTAVRSTDPTAEPLSSLGSVRQRGWRPCARRIQPSISSTWGGSETVTTSQPAEGFGLHPRAYARAGDDETLGRRPAHHCEGDARNTLIRNLLEPLGLVQGPRALPGETADRGQFGSAVPRRVRNPVVSPTGDASPACVTRHIEREADEATEPIYDRGPVISPPAPKPTELNQPRDRRGVEFNHNTHLALSAPFAVTAHPLSTRARRWRGRHGVGLSQPWARHRPIPTPAPGRARLVCGAKFVAHPFASR
jgi:hypothetical protein